MIAAKPLLTLLSAGAFILGLHRANAAVDDMAGLAFENQVQQMTDLVLEIVPVGRIFDDAASSDPAWPLSERAAEKNPTQLACLRTELASPNLREYKVAEVRKYAAANPKGFAEDLALLNSDAGRELRQHYATRSQDFLSGRQPRGMRRTPQDASEPWSRAAATLISDAKHQALRKLIGMSRGSANSVPFSALLLPVMRKCKVGGGIDVYRPPAPLRTQITFAARCGSSVTVATSGVLASPREDPRHPRPQPLYPADARLRGEQGLAAVEVYVTEKGLVQSATLRKSSGFPALDAEALKSVGTWQLVPGELDGKPACMWLTFGLGFNLEEQDRSEVTR